MSEPSTQAPAFDSSRFVKLLTAGQCRLYAYIVTLLGRGADADDLLQATNAALWAKAAEYDPARPFLTWAYRFAHLQVLAFRKQKVRDRLRFDDELLNNMAAEFERQDEGAERQLEALATCLEGMRPDQRELIRQRYASGRSVSALAVESGTTENRLSAALYRVRKMLGDCIRRRLAGGTT